MAFQNFQLPNWVSFNTFHHVGSAIPGMYPDFTLWPLVFITNFVSLPHQVILIRTITCFLTYIGLLSALLFGFKVQNKLFASLLSFIYATSGYALLTFAISFQPSIAIVYATIPWIIITTMDWLRSEKINIYISIKLSVFLTIVVYSHLLSTVVWLISFAPLIVWYLFFKRNILVLLNGGIALAALLMSTSPFLFRFFTIKTSGLLNPFGIGNANGQSFFELIGYSSMWGAQNSLALPWVLIILLLLITKQRKINKNQTINIFMLAWLAYLTTTLAPLDIFNSIPILDSFQYTPWRFGPYLAIPAILLIAKSVDETRQKITRTILVGICIISAGFCSYSFLTTSDPLKSLGARIQGYTLSKPIKITEQDLENDSLNQTIIPDYAPEGIGVMKGDDSQLSKFGHLINKEHLVVTKHKEYKYSVGQFNNQNITLVSNTDANHHALIPIYGYNNLEYTVKVNGSRKDYSINTNGIISILSSVSKNDKINVSISIPKSYYILLIFSLIFISAELFIVFKPHRASPK